MVVLAGFSVVASAQIKFGGGLSYGTEAKNLGFNVRGEYVINDQISIVPGFTYFLPKDLITWWELNADVHYGFNEKFYGLGGLNYTTVKIDLPEEFGFLGAAIDNSSSEIGLNLGAGYKFTDKFFGEAKYVLGSADQLTLTVGILFGGK